MENKTNETFRSCCAVEIPAWVKKRIAKMSWDNGPDEVVVCGKTMMYRHGDKWGYATLSQRGRDTVGMGAYALEEEVRKAARVHG